MQLIYYKTVLGHELWKVPGFNLQIYRTFSVSRDEFGESTMKLAMGTTYKTIKHYWPLFVTIFDTIFLWGWISLVSNMRIDVAVLLLYLWVCRIKLCVKNRTSGLHRTKAEWLRMESKCEWIICAQQTWVTVAWGPASVVCSCSRFCYACVKGSKTWPILWRMNRAPVTESRLCCIFLLHLLNSEALMHEFRQETFRNQVSTS